MTVNSLKGNLSAPQVVSVSFAGVRSEVLLHALEDKGIYVSSGSACHKGKPSHVYAALKLPKPQLDGILRSASPTTPPGRTWTPWSRG